MKTLLALSLAALAGSTTLASADTYFSIPTVQDKDGIVELGTISSDADGMVELYSLRGGEKGPLLGWEMLNAGANSDVKVPLATTDVRTALAEIVLDGQVVATQRIRLEN